MEEVGKLTVMFVLLAVSGVVNAFVIMKLWMWIITPMFGIEEISMSYAYGLSVIITFCRMKRTDKDEDKSFGEKIAEGIGWMIAHAGFFLLIGWIASLLIS